MANALPDHVWRQILLECAVDDLLRHVATCALVCRAWRWFVSDSPAFVGKLLGQEERAAVLRAISAAAAHARREDGSFVVSCFLGSEGGEALGAFLRAWPGDSSLGTAISVTSAGLMGSVAPAIAAGLRHGLLRLSMDNNPCLGDSGVRAIAAALPSTLESLSLRNVGCGNSGMNALAAALPATSVRVLAVDKNSAIGEPGWRALGRALPQLTQLDGLFAYGCQRMGCSGLSALAEGLPDATALRELMLDGSTNDGGLQALAAVLPRCDALDTLYLRANGFTSTGANALAAALPSCSSMRRLIITENDEVDEESRDALRAAAQEVEGLMVAIDELDEDDFDALPDELQESDDEGD